MVAMVEAWNAMVSQLQYKMGPHAEEGLRAFPNDIFIVGCACLMIYGEWLGWLRHGMPWYLQLFTLIIVNIYNCRLGK